MQVQHTSGSSMGSSSSSSSSRGSMLWHCEWCFPPGNPLLLTHSCDHPNERYTSIISSPAHIFALDDTLPTASSCSHSCCCCAAAAAAAARLVCCQLWTAP
jgi:hypothetical protein